jgi:hypothetical protein
VTGAAAHPWVLPRDKRTRFLRETNIGRSNSRMNRLPAEALLCESAEDLLDDFTALAVDGMTPDEIACYRRQLQQHLTRVDAYRHERSVLRSLDRCGLGGEWARRELVRLWAAKPEEEMLEVPIKKLDAA